MEGQGSAAVSYIESGSAKHLLPMARTGGIEPYKAFCRLSRHRFRSPVQIDPKNAIDHDIGSIGKVLKGSLGLRDPMVSSIIKPVGRTDLPKAQLLLRNRHRPGCD
jgi:hypothetical protein